MSVFLSIIIGIAVYVAVRVVGHFLGYDPSFGESVVVIVACALSWSAMGLLWGIQ